MFIKHKPYLQMSLVLTGLMFASSSETETTKSGNIYHPTTICELIADIEAANADGLGPNIVDLGGLAFELTDPCDEAAALCGSPATVAGCFANGLSYSHGPTGLPELTGSMSIVNGRIVRANNAPIDIDPFRILTLTSNQTTTGALSLFKVALENGDAEPVLLDSGNGGAVYVDNRATLNIQSSKIAFNQAFDSGGGIYVAGGGTLDVQKSIISNNTAKAANVLNLKAGGGGIYLARAGVLGASLGSLDNSTISYNSSYGLGGGLNNQGSAADIFNSTFSYNATQTPVPGSGESGPGFNPSGAGGGIYNDITATFLQITQSTFWMNRSLVGGGIYNEEARATAPGVGVYMNNNTIAHNFAQMNGGGLYNAGFINQYVSNLAGNNIDFSNAAPDIWSIPNGVLTGFANPPLPNPAIGVITEGFNFVGDCGTTAQCQLVNDVNKDIVGGTATVNTNIDPRLHDLGWNGGPTETVALFPDSPAVNNGYNNLSLVFDQRGPKFFRTVGQTDIGSYEVQYDSLHTF